MSEIKTSIVTSWNELHAALQEYQRDTRWQFRGHADSAWPLLPKAGRAEFSHYDERKLFRQWDRGAVQHLDLTRFTIWEKLAIAQHYGLATRLLDWTHNPLIAAFFAVIEARETDAAIFAIQVTKRLRDEDFPDPFEVKDAILYYQPRISSPRLQRQVGHFTVHGPATLALADHSPMIARVEKIVIARSLRDQLVFDLHYYGFNHSTIFPDLEGLSLHLAWWVRNTHHWNPDALPEQIETAEFRPG
jgi:hypothetical protein